MTNIKLLTEEDVHQIAYLTLHGWEFTTYNGWAKEGFTDTEYVAEGCGCHSRAVETDSFSRSDAYWKQREASDE